MIEIKINTEYIKLSQLIKFAGLSFDGAMANEMVREEKVKVNGEIDTRRGRKLYPDDEVEITTSDKKVILKVMK